IFNSIRLRREWLLSHDQSTTRIGSESMDKLRMRAFLPVVAGRCQHRLTPFPPSYATEKPCIAVDESSFLHGVPPASPCSHRWRFPPKHTEKSAQVRPPSEKTKSAPLDRVIKETLKLWRKSHLPYDQTRYVAKEARPPPAIPRPLTRQRVIARLS